MKNLRRIAIGFAAAATLLLADLASAFVISQPPSRIASGEMTFELNLSLNGAANSPSGTSWDQGFVDALDAWNDAPGLGPLVELDANLGSFEDPCEPNPMIPATIDGLNGVDFLPTECGTAFGMSTLAVARRQFTLGGLFTEGNIVFKNNPGSGPGQVNWDIFNGSLTGSTDFRRVAVHEVGHLLGLGHPPTTAAIMYFQVQPNVEIPQNDDIDGIDEIYNVGCPQFMNAASETINGTLELADCFGTEAGILTPTTVGNCNLFGPGTHEADSFVDLYRVTLPAGESLSVTMSIPGNNAVFQVLDSTLSTELECRVASNPGANASVTFSPGAGQYVVVARTLFEGQGADYTLTLAPEPGGALLGFVALAALGAAGRRHRTRP